MTDIIRLKYARDKRRLETELIFPGKQIKLKRFGYDAHVTVSNYFPITGIV